jgi:hypothetical protein
MSRNLTYKEQRELREHQEAYERGQRVAMIAALISLFIGLVILPALVGGA